LERTLVIELHCLPGIAYFCLIQKYNNLRLEVCESFQKQTYRNRYRILTANGMQQLTVPVQNANSHLPIGEVTIDYSVNWMKDHWRALQSAYGRSPYFEHYAPQFEAQLFSEEMMLINFNEQLLSLCLDISDIKPEVSKTGTYQKVLVGDQVDFRSRIHPKKTGDFDFFIPRAYLQVFGSKFVPNLSILDLIFCEGPHTSQVIRESINPEFEL
jgi:hypothetical protein